MIKIIQNPTIIKGVGEKLIEEYIGNVNSETKDVSIARMKSPYGWTEPGQCPEFDEYTLVFKGILKVITKTGDFLINEGQAIITQKGDWVQYSTPFEDGAEYISVCLPGFSPDTVNRD